MKPKRSSYQKTMRNQKTWRLLQKTKSPRRRHRLLRSVNRLHVPVQTINISYSNRISSRRIVIRKRITDIVKWRRCRSRQNVRIGWKLIEKWLKIEVFGWKLTEKWLKTHIFCSKLLSFGWKYAFLTENKEKNDWKIEILSQKWDF